MCQRDSFDEDAELIGIDKEVWRKFRRMQNWKQNSSTQFKARELPKDWELPKERELPPKRLYQMEFKEITQPIDDREAFLRRKQNLVNRWFGYYKKCSTQKKMGLIDQFNKIATMKQR